MANPKKKRMVTDEALQYGLSVLRGERLKGVTQEESAIIAECELFFNREIRRRDKTAFVTNYIYQQEHLHGRRYNRDHLMHEGASIYEFEGGKDIPEPTMSYRRYRGYDRNPNSAECPHTIIEWNRHLATWICSACKETV